MTEPCTICRKVRPDSPSSYFCSDECQRIWHARRALPALPDSTAVSPHLANLTHWRVA